MKKTPRRQPTAIVMLACAALLRPVAARAAEDDPATQQARALYRDGLKAYTDKHYDDARTAFLKVHELKPLEVEVLRDLGAAEVRTGNAVEGAQHLDDWLRLSAKGTEKERDAVRQLLSEAKQDVGALQIAVDTADAEVMVDGRSVGRSPLAHDIYVTPGRHVVDAQKAGALAEDIATASTGVVTAIMLSPRPPVPPPIANTESTGNQLKTGQAARPRVTGRTVRLRGRNSLNSRSRSESNTRGRCSGEAALRSRVPASVQFFFAPRIARKRTRPNSIDSCRARRIATVQATRRTHGMKRGTTG